MRKKLFVRLAAAALLIAVTCSLILPVAAKGSALYSSVDVTFDSDTASGTNVKGEFLFTPSMDVGLDHTKSTYYYRDSYFTAPATTYNPHLATMSLALTLSSFWSGSAWNMYMQYDNAAKLLHDVGFEHIEANYATDGRPTADTIGILMSHKTVIENDGTPYNLVTITVRSSGYGSEWASNMIMGHSYEYDGNHKGFSIARDRALEYIYSYLDKYVDGNTKFWITGFSRGGAVGGMLGAWMDDNISALKSDLNVRTSRNDIFTYTFEAPTSFSRKNTANKNYSNIFNIINSEDPITYLPFGTNKENGWDFVHPGVVHRYEKPSAERITAIERELKKFNPYLRYALDEFVPFMNPLGKDQATFLANFTKAFSAKLDRETYATSIERDFARLTSQFMAGSDKETEIMFGKLGALMMEDLGITRGASNSDIMSILLPVLGGTDSAIDSLCRMLGENMEEVGAIEVYDDAAHSCLKTILKVLLSTDGGNLVPYIVTIISNNVVFKDAYGRNKTVNMIFAGHCPEIILASLMVDDSYYKGTSLVDFREPSDDETVTVTVNLGEKHYYNSYKVGSRVTLSANAEGCYKFDGWYLGGELVSDSAEYSFAADSSTTLDLSIKAEHLSVGEWISEREATETEDGLRYKLCSACGETAVIETLPKLSSPSVPELPDSPTPDASETAKGGSDNTVLAIAVLSVVAIVAFGGGTGLAIFAFSRRKHKKK